MTQTISLSPAVTLHCVRDSRFKQGCLSLHLLRPMDREEAAANALIPAVLLRGTRLHPDIQSITLHLDSLYGAGIGAQVRQVGDYQSTGFVCSFMEDRFALPEDQVLAPVIAFLEELLLDPALEAGCFRQDFVQSEKKNLISAIESEINDKRAYALRQLLRLMCREDAFGLSRLGEIPQVQALEPEGLYRHYRKILRESPIEVFYEGSAQPETVAQLLRPLFAQVDRAPVALAEQTGFHPCPGQDSRQIQDVAQGKLCMGFVTAITHRDPAFAAMQVLNVLYGGGMTSKLFANVRERLSLCYSVGSTYYSSKGILVVHAGIDFDKEEAARQEILAQLAACQAGSFSAQELESARQALLSSLRAVPDSPSAHLNYCATSCLSGMNLTLEQYMAAVAAVTAEQVVAAAGTLQLHSTYFLRGEEA